MTSTGGPVGTCAATQPRESPRSIRSQGAVSHSALSTVRLSRQSDHCSGSCATLFRREPSRRTSGMRKSRLVDPVLDIEFPDPLTPGTLLRPTDRQDNPGGQAHSENGRDKTDMPIRITLIMLCLPKAPPQVGRSARRADARHVRDAAHVADQQRRHAFARGSCC
jgi:hypothetical protein